MTDADLAALTAATMRTRTGRQAGGPMAVGQLPRRVVTVYMPLVCFLIILLFPFYWMAITTFKPNDELYNYNEHNPFWITSPTLDQHQQAAVRDRLSALAGDHHDGRGRRRPSSRCSPACSPPMRSSGCASRARQWVGLGDLPRLSGAAVDPVHPAGDHGVQLRPVRQPAGADPDLSDLPDPVLHLAADRLLQVDPLRAGGMRADRRRHAPADPAPDHAAAGRARPDLGRHLRLHAVLERVHLRARLHPVSGEQDRAGRDPDRAGRPATSTTGAR